MKLLIRQGRLVDPVGGIGGVMDILMEDGKVTVIGSNINEPGAQIIDAAGLTVCWTGGYARPPAGARI